LSILDCGSRIANMRKGAHSRLNCPAKSFLNSDVSQPRDIRIVQIRQKSKPDGNLKVATQQYVRDCFLRIPFQNRLVFFANAPEAPPNTLFSHCLHR